MRCLTAAPGSRAARERYLSARVARSKNSLPPENQLPGLLIPRRPAPDPDVPSPGTASHWLWTWMNLSHFVIPPWPYRSRIWGSSLLRPEHPVVEPGAPIPGAGCMCTGNRLQYAQRRRCFAVFLRPTRIAPTDTRTTPASARIAPTGTRAAPTSARIAPTATGIAPTATGIAPTATGIAPTATGIVPTATGIVPTATGIVPTATGIVPRVVSLFDYSRKRELIAAVPTDDILSRRRTRLVGLPRAAGGDQVVEAGAQGRISQKGHSPAR